MRRLDKIKSCLECKCPHCRIGKVFVGSPYAIRKRRINDICSYCSQYFEIEPGYFYVALYISYFMMMIEGGFMAGLLYLLTGSESIWVYLSGTLAFMLSLAPINFRYSRMLLLYYMSPKIKYDPRYRQELED